MWLPPALADFRARFPVFSSVADPAVETILVEARRGTNDSWTEADRTSATLYLAAHLLASEGFGGTAGSNALTGPVKRRKVGDVETEFAGPGQGSGSSSSQYATTIYGQRYLSLLRLNSSPVAVV